MTADAWLGWPPSAIETEVRAALADAEARIAKAVEVCTTAADPTRGRLPTGGLVCARAVLEILNGATK